jgi:plasmid stabilization system protein ParE
VIDFVVSPEARANLFSIWEFIAGDSIDAADSVTEEIEKWFGRLAEMPGMGHFLENVMDRHFKFWRVHSYLICYRWDVLPIQIVAVVHGARDLDAFFENRALGSDQ